MDTTRNLIIDNIKQYFSANEPLIIKKIRSLYLEAECECKKIKNNSNYATEEYINLKEDFERLQNENSLTTRKYDVLFSKEKFEEADIDILCDYLFYWRIYNEMSDHIQNLNLKKTRDTTYFSSYSTDISSSDFYSKTVCWFTSRIHQSLLFQLERFRDIKESSPVIFEFNLLHKSINLLYSNEPTNMNILKFFSLDHLMTQENSFRDFLISMGVSKDLAPKTLANNKFILFFCEAFNNFIMSDPLLSKHSSLICVHGYVNPKDQHEIAIIKFNEFVDPDTVIKSKYVKIVKNGTEYPVPLGKDFREAMEQQCIYKNKLPGRPSECAPMSSIDITKDDNLRMSCGQNTNIQIYYQNELTGEINIFDCANKQEEFYWRTKYLKYKNKYLSLKNKLK